MKKIILIMLISILILAGCTNPNTPKTVINDTISDAQVNSEIDELRRENETLKKQLEDSSSYPSYVENEETSVSSQSYDVVPPSSPEMGINDTSIPTAYDRSFDALGYYGLNISTVKQILGESTVKEVGDAPTPTIANTFTHDSGMQFETYIDNVFSVFLSFDDNDSGFTMMGIGGSSHTRKTVVELLGEPDTDSADGILYNVGYNQCVKFFLDKKTGKITAAACFSPST